MSDIKSTKIVSQPGKHPIYYIVIICVIIIIVVVLKQSITMTFVEPLQNDKPKDDKTYMKEYQEVQLYAENFLEKWIDIKRDKNKVVIEGAIKNKGNLLLNDIELTAFFIDGTAKPLRDYTFIAKSTDGKPLLHYERRPFRVEFDDSQNSSAEIKLLITNIDFATKGKNGS